MEKLPDEIVVKIFLELDIETKCQVESVSRRWQACLWETYNSTNSLVVNPVDSEVSLEAKEMAIWRSKIFIR